MVGPEEAHHARPAARFDKTAKRFSSMVTVVRDGREANAKSPLKMMTLGARRGDTLTIRAEDDVRQAVDALAVLFSADGS